MCRLVIWFSLSRKIFRCYFGGWFVIKMVYVSEILILNCIMIIWWMAWMIIINFVCKMIECMHRIISIINRIYFLNHIRTHLINNDKYLCRISLRHDHSKPNSSMFDNDEYNYCFLRSPFEMKTQIDGTVRQIWHQYILMMVIQRQFSQFSHSTFNTDSVVLQFSIWKLIHI